MAQVIEVAVDTMLLPPGRNHFHNLVFGEPFAPAVTTDGVFELGDRGRFVAVAAIPKLPPFLAFCSMPKVVPVLLLDW